MLVGATAGAALSFGLARWLRASGGRPVRRFGAAGPAGCLSGAPGLRGCPAGAAGAAVSLLGDQLTGPGWPVSASPPTSQPQPWASSRAPLSTPGSAAPWATRLFGAVDRAGRSARAERGRLVGGTGAPPSEQAGAWTGLDVQDGAVDELLDVAIERPVLRQLQVEVGCAPEDRVQSALTGDHRKERHLDDVDSARPPSAPGSSTGCRANAAAFRLLPEPGDDVDGIAAHHGRIQSVQGPSTWSTPPWSAGWPSG